MTNENPDAKPLTIFPAQIEEATQGLRELVYKTAALKNVNGLRIYQAEWHVRGVAYHCRNVFRNYKLFASEVGKRAAATSEPPSTIIMHAPVAQELLFEFYALVNLARISLDNLRNLLQPTFTTQLGQMPKSVSDYSKGTTDCPVYEWLADQPVVSYLSDLRNCLVHYRSFATSDNALVIQEGAPDSLKDYEDMAELFKAEFRVVAKRTISVNVLLPDTIFEFGNEAKKLAHFTYDLRVNMLSQSREFLLLVSESTKQALALLSKIRKPIYTFKKR